MLDGHFGGEDLLVAPRHLQVAVAVVSRQQITMPRVLGDVEQPLDGDVGLGDVEVRHDRSKLAGAGGFGAVAGGEVSKAFEHLGIGGGGTAQA